MTDDQIIDGILKREGGYVNHPADPGGATNRGITFQTLMEWRSDATLDDLKALTEDEARAIYRERYIHAPGFGAIENGALRALVVDCGVNHGITGATKMIQRAVGVPADGVFGAVTLAALNAGGMEAYWNLCAERVRWYGRHVAANPDKLPFLSGWLNRVADFIEA